MRQNIPRSQKQALNTLQKDTGIVIKEADKGGAIVIMDKNYYKEKILEQLNDRNFYREIDGNMDKTTMQVIGRLVTKYQNHITDKEQNFLLQFEVKTSNFYGLPKIHKSMEIQDAISQQNNAYVYLHSPADLKFRPIVAGPQCPTHRLSNFIDIILKPLCHFRTI